MKYEGIEDMLWIHESNAIENIYDEKEDNRSYKAWIELLEVDNLTVKNILKLHYDIMCKLNPKIAGKIRTCEVVVGNYLCLHYSTLNSTLDTWIMSQAFDDTFLDIKKSHISFEKMHPFEDGNGRVGRMLMNWALVKRGKPPCVILEKGKYIYYKWFR